MAVFWQWLFEFFLLWQMIQKIFLSIISSFNYSTQYQVNHLLSTCCKRRYSSSIMVLSESSLKSSSLHDERLNHAWDQMLALPHLDLEQLCLCEKRCSWHGFYNLWMVTISSFCSYRFSLTLFLSSASSQGCFHFTILAKFLLG